MSLLLQPFGSYLGSAFSEEIPVSASHLTVGQATVGTYQKHDAGAQKTRPSTQYAVNDLASPGN
jgi:hypothetical protein